MPEETPDINAVQDFIKEQVRSAMAEVQQAATPQVDADAQLRRQMGETLQPFIQPAVTLGASALDHSRFYTSNPDAVAQHEEIERLFEESVRTNRNLSRQDIHDYIQGKRLRTDPEAFNKEREERSAKQKEVATTAVDVGFSAMDKAKNDPNWTNFAAKTVEEMESALDGIAF